MNKPIKQIYDRPPLDELEIARVNEINFNNLLRFFSEKFASPMMVGQFLNFIALYIGVPADNLNVIANKSFTSKSFPVKPEELIEIYYRVDFSRRDIQKMLKIGDRRITDVVSQEGSFIQEPEFTQAELMMAMRFVRFFTDASEEII